MKTDKKLTSVNILDDVYKKFKQTNVDSPINLQKLVNRSLDLYNTDEIFRDLINNHTSLGSPSSRY